MEGKLKGLMLITGCAGVGLCIMRWEGPWLTFGRVLICALCAAIGVIGLVVFCIGLATSPCQIVRCRKAFIRTCDYRMVEESCGRECCKDHIHTVGDRDYCPDHYEQL